MPTTTASYTGYSVNFSGSGSTATLGQLRGTGPITASGDVLSNGHEVLGQLSGDIFTDPGISSHTYTYYGLASYVVSGTTYYGILAYYTGSTKQSDCSCHPRNSFPPARPSQC